jgi:hypothetical protein
MKITEKAAAPFVTCAKEGAAPFNRSTKSNHFMLAASRTEAEICQGIVETSALKIRALVARLRFIATQGSASLRSREVAAISLLVAPAFGFILRC